MANYVGLVLLFFLKGVNVNYDFPGKSYSQDSISEQPRDNEGWNSSHCSTADFQEKSISACPLCLEWLDFCS